MGWKRGNTTKIALFSLESCHLLIVFLSVISSGCTFWNFIHDTSLHDLRWNFKKWRCWSGIKKHFYQFWLRLKLKCGRDWGKAKIRNHEIHYDFALATQTCCSMTKDESLWYGVIDKQNITNFIQRRIKGPLFFSIVLTFLKISLFFFFFFSIF